MLRLLLINPSNIHKGPGNIRQTAWPSLNLPYLSAVTPRHYQIRVLDENIEPFEYREADIVGIKAYTASVYRAYQIAQIYRKQGITTVMGGIYVSIMTKPTPFPCTQFWESLKDWDDYCATKLVFKPAQMSIEGVYEGFTYLRKTYYSFWETAKRSLSTLLTTKSMIATLIAYKFNASYRKVFRNSQHYRLYSRPSTKKKFTPVYS